MQSFMAFKQAVCSHTAAGFRRECWLCHAYSSVCLEGLGSKSKDFRKILYFEFYKKNRVG